MSLDASHVIRSGDFVADALRPGIDLDWSAPAEGLEWTVDFTIAHLTGAVAKYTLYLASRSTRFIAVRMETWPGAAKRERVESIVGVSKAMAAVAGSTPPHVRAYHNVGMLDVSGYCGLACVELLVHGYDAAAGLGLRYEPPDDLCRDVMARMFPWRRPGGWADLLDATGRPGGDDRWTLLGTPLDEWDGSEPAADQRPVLAWTFDGARWQPVYA